MVLVEVGEAHWIGSVDIRGGGIGVGCDCFDSIAMWDLNPNIF